MDWKSEKKRRWSEGTESRYGARWLQWLLLAFLIVAPSAAWAQVEILLKIDNDGRNSKFDDLYTAGLGLTIGFDRLSVAGGEGFVTFKENLFTDRDNGLRFDETWLQVGSRHEGRRWQAKFFTGAVHAGHGLLGEEAQNLVHRLTGDELYQLDYVDESELFPVFGAQGQMVLREWGRFLIESTGELTFAPGFQMWAGARIRAHWIARPRLRLFAGAGARVSHTEYEPLEPWIKRFGPEVEVGVELMRRFVFTGTYNEYGTGMGHISFGIRVTTRKPSRHLRSAAAW
ncbi:hypothetical protein ACFL39_00305 [Gemmatimonadota bacterium]